MSGQPANTRYVALKMCLSVIEHGRSLSQVLGEGLAQFSDRRERGFTQNLVLGTLRWQERLAAIRSHLLKKPMKAKDEDVNQLILIGLYQLLYLDTPPHAAVSETVALTQKLKKPWAKALVNGVLRNFIRDADAIEAEVDLKPAYKYSHPQWLTKAMRKAYPDHWQSILTANNQPAPLSLRVNQRQSTRDEFKTQLDEMEIANQTSVYSPAGLILEQSMDVSQLPGFENGDFSVQDIAAQQAGYLLNPQPGEKVLDACAAPGGKTTHLLELADNQLDLLALEKEPERIERLSENLYRLQLEADVEVGDASQPSDWWNGELFDKILLDAPCSATGIIRRHPDIKWHRTAEDIDALIETQADILKALWPTLKPGGKLLYATCSVMPQENGKQLRSFLADTPDAHEIPLDVNWGLAQMLPGKQILPGESGMDGFYYCLLQKGEH